MKRVAFGFIALWAGVNFFLGVIILFAMAILNRNAPGLRILYSPFEVAQIDPKALATINGLAIFANACAAAYSALALLLLWRSLKHHEQWAFRALWATSLPLQAMGYVSDTYFENRNLWANVCSTGLLAFGLVATRIAMKQEKTVC